MRDKCTSKAHIEALRVLNDSIRFFKSWDQFHWKTRRANQRLSRLIFKLSGERIGG